MTKITKKKAATVILGILLIVIISLITYRVYTNELYVMIWHSISSYLVFFITIYSFFIGIVIFMESKNPSKTIAWLLVLFLVPVIGFIFYIFMGQNFRKKKVFKKKKYIDSKHLTDLAKLQREFLKEIKIKSEHESFVKSRLIKLLLRNSNSPFTVNNKTEILTNGKNTFDSLKSALNDAKNHIHMEYFIIRNDNIGNEIKDILINKAREGVEVRVIYDSVGCWKLSKKYINSLKKAGVEIYPFLPVAFPVLSRELNYRNHRKIVVVDGKIGFTGGLNIGDEYLGKNPQLGFWRDTHIKIEGEAVYSLQNIFLKDWEFVSHQYITGEDYYPKQKHYGEEIIQLTSSGIDSNTKAIMQAYFTMISAAEDRIWITTPYLVPEDSINVALMAAALSGVDVRIIIPKEPDHIIVHWASMANVEDLLKAGVKIYTYKKGFIHSKVLTVDGIGASVGTANLDVRSLELNFEVNAFIYDKDLVKRLDNDFKRDLENSKEIILQEHLERSIIQRLKESLGRLLSPLL